MPRFAALGLPLAFALLLVLGLSIAPSSLAQPQGVSQAKLVPAWPGVKFKWPVGVVHAGDGTNVLYVLELDGRVKRIGKPGTGAASAQATTFLDLSSRVYSEQQGGLLGLAFHPKYRENGRLFVSYLTPTGDANVKFKIVLSEFRAQAAVCNTTTERVLMEIPKSTAMHNGGGLLFGPKGMLFMSTGDNKIQKEAKQTSQNPASLLGKILRIDVDQRPGGAPYGIPGDNPWATAGGSVRSEIWAYGFRNPWRFSFDATGGLWTCEPGTKGECLECVVKVQRGGNHGWPFFEGTRAVEALPPNLQGMQFVKPVFEYVRTGGEGTTAALGGFFYRGSRIPMLRGAYVFGDYGRGVALVIDVTGGRGSNLRVLGRVPDMSSLGEDDKGELYFCAMEEGVVYTMVTP